MKVLKFGGTSVGSAQRMKDEPETTMCLHKSGFMA